MVDRQGRPLTLTIEEASAFTDYMTVDNVIAQELSQIGIKATVKGVSVNAWVADLGAGQFQLTTSYSVNMGPTPYEIYEAWLDSRLSAPLGKNAVADYGRWNDPQTQSALSAYRNATTDAGRRAAVGVLERVVATELPVIPLMYGAAWGEYVNKDYTGWPSVSNPYEPAGVSCPGSEVVALRIKPRS